MRRVLYWVRSILFPRRCMLCRRFLVKQEANMCHHCRTSAPEYPFGARKPDPAGKNDRHFLDSFTAVWYYEEDVRRSILRYKFRKAVHLAPKFGALLAMKLLEQGPEQIDVLVHPQSIVHSMVEFDDGAIKAQLGAPDMHLPIQFALRFPHRGECGESRFSFADNPTLTFERVDDVRFPMLNTAYECLRKGGNSCCVMNGANEVAVASFLGGRIKYIDIAHVIQQTLSRATFVAHPSVEDYALSNEESRRIAEEIVRGICNK